MSEGFKETKGKTRWTLLPMDALEEVVKVLEYGAKTKYAMDNWKKVQHFGAYADAIMRHWVKYFVEEEELDPESGLSHLAHLMCDALFVEWHRKKRGTQTFIEYVQGLKTYPDYVVEVDKARFEKNGGVLELREWAPKYGEIIEVKEDDEDTWHQRIFEGLCPDNSGFICVDDFHKVKFIERKPYTVTIWTNARRYKGEIVVCKY